MNPIPHGLPLNRTLYGLGLGANLGGQEEMAARLGLAVVELLAAIRQHDPIVRAASPLYVTQPYGRTDQPVFLNGGITLEVSAQLLPPDLLAACKAVERGLGRQVRERWGPREVDLDILIMEPGSWQSPELIVPHQDLTNRRFALVPLCDMGWSERIVMGPSDPILGTADSARKNPLTLASALIKLQRHDSESLLARFSPEEWMGSDCPVRPY